MATQFMCRIVTLLTALLLTSSAFAAPFVAPRDPQCVAFSPDGALVALGFSGQSNGEFPPRPHPDVRKCGCVQIHSAADGKRLRRIETYGDLVDLRFSPDGKYLAMARLFVGANGVELDEVRVWTAADGKPMRVFDRCHAFAFAPDSQQIIVLGRKKCVEFDLKSGERIRTIDELGSALTVQFVGEDKLVGALRDDADPPQYSLKLVDYATGKALAASSPFADPIYHVAVSTEGRLLATGLPAGGVLVWDTAELKPVAKLTMGTRGVAHPFFSPDGELLAAGDQASGDVVIWQLVNGQELHRYTFEKGSFRPHYPRGESERERPERDPARFVFSPDGEAFLVGSYGGIVRLVSSGQDVKRFGE